MNAEFGCAPPALLAGPWVERLTMKIQSLLAYCVPLSVVLIIGLTLLASAPPESAAAKACRQIPGCMSILPSFQGLAGVR